ncbi:MAG TPA: hypothetical protein VNV66_06815 [Pilimelia sp.]|nr:hypothetical protein [Pilimelia sp.]
MTEPPSGTSPAPAVLQWGSDPAPGRAGGLPPRAVHRATRALALAGGAALAGSLFTTWRRITFTTPRGDEHVVGLPREITTSALDLAAPGAAYLFGVLALGALGTIALSGAGSRRTARLGALAVCAGLLILLAAIVHHLQGHPSSDVTTWFTYHLDQQPETDTSYGAGLYLAFGGLLLGGLALLPQPTGTDPAGPGGVAAAPREAGTAAADGGPTPPAGGLAAWRRPADPDGPDAPLDLTVAPAAPFLPVPPDRPGR